MIPGYFAPIDHYVAGLGGTTAYDLENKYIKQSFRNRCRIYGSNGMMNLVIPVNHPNNGLAMENLSINRMQAWPKNHFRTLCSAYGKSAFFTYFLDEVAAFYESDISGLSEFLIQSNQLVKSMASQLRIALPSPDQVLYEKILASDQVPVCYRYFQPFEIRNGFIGGLSILDMLFCAGPETETLLNLQRIRLREHFSL